MGGPAEPRALTGTLLGRAKPDLMLTLLSCLTLPTSIAPQAATSLLLAQQMVALGLMGV